MDKASHAAAVELNGKLFSNPLFRSLPDEFSPPDKFDNPLRRAAVGRLIGFDTLQEIEKVSRKLTFFKWQEAIFIRDGDTFTYMFVPSPVAGYTSIEDLWSKHE